MGQFPCDAVETMVQMGLQTVCVVDRVESCQNQKGDIFLRAGEGNPFSEINVKFQKLYFFFSFPPQDEKFLLGSPKNVCRSTQRDR